MFSRLTSHLKPTQHDNRPPGPPSSLYAAPPGPPPSSAPPPPGYKLAAGKSHETSSESNATEDDYLVADNFCRQYPSAFPARIFPATEDFGLEKWGIVERKDPFADATKVPGMTLISVELDKRSFWSRRLNHRLVLEKPPSVDNRAAHFKNRGDACLTSNLPIIAGHYNSATKRGVYFEITIRQMEGNAIIALGMQCLPYPPNRLPGWHRKSAALHFDDRRIYFDDSEGGIDYMRDVYNPQLGTSIKQHNVPEIKAMDIVGCGYEFPLNVGGVGSLFYTYNGERLPAAFPAIFDPKEEGQEFDVFAAVGFTDGPCQFDVNFGLTTFKWSDANSYLREWTVEGLFRQLGDGPPQYGS